MFADSCPMVSRSRSPISSQMARQCVWSRRRFSWSMGIDCPHLALSSDLDAHVLDFGTYVLYPHSAPSIPSGLFDEPFRAAPEPAVKTKPPEQDLDFAGSL